MPNWVTTSFTVSGKDSKAFMDMVMECMKEKKGLFNTLIPRPQTYNDFDTTNYSARHRRQSLRIGEDLPSWGAVRTESGKVTNAYIRAFSDAEKEQEEKYGVVGWYDWDCANWGTKWDASDLYANGDFVSFMTAWSFPEQIFNAIAEKYDISCTGTFEEEGNFHGDFDIQDRQLHVEYHEGSGEDDEEDEILIC